MTPEIIISLVFSAVLAVFASITAPVILMNRTAAMHREDRLADYARQDAMAAEARAANEKAAADTNGKLDAIHGLVDGAMTAAMRAELEATKRELAMMREVAAIKQAAGHEPTLETLAAIEATAARTQKLESALADRLAAIKAFEQPPTKESP